VKTTLKRLSIALLLGINLNVGITAAQQDSVILTSGLHSTDVSTHGMSSKELTPIADNTAEFTAKWLTVDEQNYSIKLNQPLPAYTYSAVLLIQDFTGRAVKTFSVNPLNATAQEFSLINLLSGTYNYTLILDDQKKIYGSFSVGD
jgi:hypothetical protein